MRILRRIQETIRRVAGMPDYDRYVEHLRNHHPESPVPGRREYFEQFVNARYGNGSSRCC
ncbi:MAG: YbdD/YjiX family protein [Gemmatimonadota bacterium]